MADDGDDSVKVGVLDLPGAIEDTVELAPLCEQLGFHRYWIAEHQPQPTPLLVVSIVAGVTESIRVGTAGILFHHYPILRTAHDFHFLERVYSERIDAGFCAGMVPDEALLADDAAYRDLGKTIADYHERVEKLVAHLRAGADAPTRWMGAAEDPPAIWYLGGSPRSGARAGALGVHFAYANMFPASRDDPAGIAAYREAFVARGEPAAAHAVVSVTGICAPTDAEARRMASGWEDKFFHPKVVGEPARCADQLAAMRERLGADEIVFADLCPDLATRVACYEGLASALELSLAPGS